MRRNVAIVGGGPGGLFTALLLGRQMATPPRITLFEAGNRLGGKIVTGRFHSGGHYEAGAAEFYDYTPIDTDPLRDLVEEFGLPIIEMGGAAAVLDGRVIGNLEQLQDRLGTAATAAFVAFDARAKASITPGDFYESGSVPGRVESGSFADHLESIADAATPRPGRNWATIAAVQLTYAEGTVATIPRNAIEVIGGTGRALMPEGFEQALSPGAFADGIEFLRPGP